MICEFCQRAPAGAEDLCAECKDLFDYWLTIAHHREREEERRNLGGI